MAVERHPETGMFTSPQPRPPGVDELRAELADTEARHAELGGKLRELAFDCLLSGSFEPAGDAAAEYKALGQRIAELRVAIPEAETAEEREEQERQRSAMISKARSLNQHVSRLKSGSRDVGLALNALAAGQRKTMDAASSIYALLDSDSGFELDSSFREIFEKHAVADATAAIAGAPGTALSDLAESVVADTKTAALELLRTARADGDAPATTDTEEQEIAA